MIKLWFLSLPFVWFTVGGEDAFACASCGSGGDDPMILYPNEKQKVHVGLGSTSGFRNIGPSGQSVTSGGPARKYTTTFAYGRSFSPRSFTTITWPFLCNERNGDVRSSSGDPSLSARYTVVMQSIVEAWKPQVQVLVGYKAAFARSLRNTAEPKTLLDVFGSGFPEVRGGLDLWYGQADTLAGFAHILSLPLARSYDGMNYQPGFTHRSTVTLGYRWAPHIKSLVGTNREAHDPIKINQTASPDSDQLNYSMFFTQDYMPDQLTTLRIMLSQQGAYGPMRNAAKSATITAAYMQSL